MKDEDNTIWGENAIKIREFIRNWGKISYPVGALISSKEKPEWDKLRYRFERYGVNMNKGGFMFTLRWTNMLLDGMGPIAEQTGFNPVGLTDDVMQVIRAALDEIDMQKPIEESQQIREEIKQGIKDRVLIRIHEMKDGIRQ